MDKQEPSSGFLKDLNLVAEAAKRAQNALLVRDFKNVSVWACGMSNFEKKNVMLVPHQVFNLKLNFNITFNFSQPISSTWRVVEINVSAFSYYFPPTL